MPKQVSYTEMKWGSYFKAPEGGHPAIIVWVMELGSEEKSYKWKPPKMVSEFRVLFEIEAEQEIYEDWEPTWKFEDKIGLIWQNYTDVITDNSNLGKLILAVHEVQSMKDIKNFSMDKLLWIKCFIDVKHSEGEKKYANIMSVSSFSKKVNYHEQQRQSFYFWLENENDFSQELLEDKDILRKFDKERIENSPEYAKLFGIETIAEQETNMKKEAETKEATPESAAAIFGE